MSKAYERALGFLTPDESLSDDVRPRKFQTELCWRCRKHDSRLPGMDAACEACFAFIEGESDYDPRAYYTVKH